MKAAIITISLSIVLFFSVASVSGEGNLPGPGEALMAFYNDCIEHKISCCDGKSHMWDSRSENLRRQARLSILKASFYSANKEKLVHEMLVRGIEAKPYKVSHYLNKRFYESLNAAYPPPITLSLITSAQ
jgi:hypothetical protein